jgi:type VI secretion system protein ImpL
MDRFRMAISELEDRNRRWWIPRFGLNESKNVEAQLKSKYCTQFKEGLLVAFDKQMTENMTDFSNSTPVDVIVSHVDHLVKRISLLRARLEDGSLESLKTVPQPSYEPIALMGDQKLIPEIRQMYAGLYLHFLAWHKDKSGFNKEMNDLKRTWLKHILSTRANLHWLVDWVNTNPSFSHLTLANFWGGSLTALDETDLPPAFTQDGKKRIGSFLEEIESALGDDRLIIASQKLEFQKWYRRAYVGAWRDFGTIFPKGADRLKGKAEWQNVAATIGTDQGPYFRFLDTMAEELKPIASGIDLPAWIDLVYYLKAARLQAPKLEASKDEGALARFREKGEKLIEKMEKQGGKIAAGTTLESRLIAARAFREYQDALAQIVPSSASRTAAYGMAADVFKEDPLTSTSPFFAAQKAISKLRTSLEKVKSDEKMFWNLVTGPLDYLWAFFCQETACQLQHLWEKEVLWEVRGVSDELVKNQLLLGSEGYARKFIDGPAEPFIGVSLRRALHQTEALGRKIDFEDAFLTFLKGGTPQPAPQPGRSHYIISVKGFPTDADTRGEILPHATELEVQCGAEPLRLINYGYGEKSFKWLPQSCGDVILKIRVADLVLTRRYSGNLAFPEFLQDFARGERTFYPRDFSKEEANLRPLGIKSITVHYEFSGHQQLLKYYRSVIALRKKMARVPERIAKCWDQ